MGYVGILAIVSACNGAIKDQQVMEPQLDMTLEDTAFVNGRFAFMFLTLCVFMLSSRDSEE